ncbi:hypothetical protein BKL49_10835 [Rodentibacter myodis]|uniref:Uncharacterized protein n=2 Tax=Rodentibacter myodis TaxID=1907939 RepID=A0A1V3JH32_9PAST|nr:hypothetical protein BKL49_10835 [Rodentibacter myodis]
MVERIGQRLIVGCVPLVAVFHPDTFYRQAWKLAVDVYNLPTEFSTMIYKFLLLGNKRLRLSIYAKTEAEARQRLDLTPDTALFIARIKGTFMRKDIPVQNHSLRNAVVVGSIKSTITNNGHRTRKTCGFFTPQIPSIGLLHLFKAEFVARSIRRNKAEFIRTNKASRLLAVVETLPRLLQVGKSNLLITNKRFPTMKTYQNSTALLAALPTPVLSSTQGGANV